VVFAAQDVADPTTREQPIADVPSPPRQPEIAESPRPDPNQDPGTRRTGPTSRRAARRPVSSSDFSAAVLPTAGQTAGAEIGRPGRGRLAGDFLDESQHDPEADHQREEVGRENRLVRKAADQQLGAQV
jgi:hypothetical protein